MSAWLRCDKTISPLLPSNGGHGSLKAKMLHQKSLRCTISERGAYGTALRSEHRGREGQSGLWCGSSKTSQL